VSAEGFSEYQVAHILVEMIIQRVPTDVPGLQIEKLTRPDVPDGLDLLVKEINASGVDGLLSLHFNATPPEKDSPDKAYSCIYPGAEKARGMAQTLLGLGFGGIYRVSPRERRDLAILSNTTVPAVLDEPVYLDRRDHRY
jgi:N-acetylmuramoyl-L-alanine amidase